MLDPGALRLILGHRALLALHDRGRRRLRVVCCDLGFGWRRDQTGLGERLPSTMAAASPAEEDMGAGGIPHGEDIRIAGMKGVAEAEGTGALVACARHLK